MSSKEPYVSVQYEAEKLSFGACKNLLPLPSKYTWGIWINQLAENVAATFVRLWTCSHWKNSLEMIDKKLQLLDIGFIKSVFKSSYFN